MVHTLCMNEVGPVLIPALAAVGGAGVTALGAYMASRERYSQRIERLAKVRESVSGNVLLTMRLERMIHHEISYASSLKRTASIFNTAIVFLLLGYTLVFFNALMRQSTGQPPIVQFSPRTSFWISLALVSVGGTLLIFAVTYRRRIIRETLPRSISEAEIGDFARRWSRLSNTEADDKTVGEDV